MLDKVIAGVDEVGRGPLAGPVVTAAVVLNPDKPIEGLRDSKKLTEKRREVLYDAIVERALAWAIGRAEVEEIDKINILQASLLAMSRAVKSLNIKIDQVLVDGKHKPDCDVPVIAVIGGDDTVPAISAASILAKVVRDREMVHLDTVYPEYGFAKHKGYGTKQHMHALKEHGACDIHRRSFAPVTRAVEQSFAIAN